MADISKIKLPDGQVYNIKDSVARSSNLISVPVPITQGGTGATTAEEARDNLEVVSYNDPESLGNFKINNLSLGTSQSTCCFIAGDNQQNVAGNYHTLFGSSNIIYGGENNFAIGFDNTCSSSLNFVAGETNTIGVDSDYSTIICGYNSNIDSSEKCFIAGNQNYIQDWSSNCYIMGDLNTISGSGTISAIGNNNQFDTSDTCVAIGFTNTFQENANTCVGIGFNNTVDSMYGLCLGNNCTITKQGSEAVAIGSNARGFTGGIAFGHYNRTSNYGSVNGTSGTAFVIGNGTASSQANAFRVNYDGTAYGLQSFHTSGADYAEYKEWEDGNLFNEDRVGLFVTLNGDKINIAQPGDFIAGIVSGTPSIVGNADECWSKTYIRDDFGRFIYGNEEDGKPLTINPDYDENQKYISRAERPEWAAIGMLGYIRVRDDGTCKVNEYCTCGENGIATSSEKGYRVVKRITDNIIEILFSIY